VNKLVEVPTWSQRSGIDTKERILDVAERLFTQFGFAGTGLRTITAQARVNLAAVNYHFGSKEALIEAVLTRRLAPLNDRRLAELDALEAARGNKSASAEEVLRAFIGAALRLSADPTEGGAVFLRLLGRAFTEPTELVRNTLQRQYSGVAARFKAAFRRALPQVPERELVWRMQFMFGAISYTMAGSDVMRLVADCEPEAARDHGMIVERLVAFLAAGLKAPVPSSAAHGDSRRRV
jgi:AcrR family transcriptional regulator